MEYVKFLLFFSFLYFFFMALLLRGLKSPFSHQDTIKEDSIPYNDSEVESEKKLQIRSKYSKSNEEIRISVSVGKKELSIIVNEVEVINFNVSHRNYSSGWKPTDFGGFYLLVLHERSGIPLKSIEHFSTLNSVEEMQLLVELFSIQPGRLVLLAAVNEVFYEISNKTKDYLRRLGSQHISHIGNGDRFLMIWSKNGRVWTENVVPCQTEPCRLWQGGTLHQFVTITSATNREAFCEEWPKDELWNRRQKFCDTHEGYGPLCSCERPFKIQRQKEEYENMKNVALLIITSKDRPTTLNRCLLRLFNTTGFNPGQTLVAIDGVDEEVRNLINVYNLQFANHDSGLSNISSRITHHYLFALTSVFQRFPSAEMAIVLEEDLLVAPDFFSYFNQLIPILLSDETLFCISAWNDFSNPHTASNPRAVQRTDGMPGLGWLLTKQLFEELKTKWPSKGLEVDWDMWLRLDDQRKGRQCLNPEVLRTYHFGSKGSHTNTATQNFYYQHMKLNVDPTVELEGLNKLHHLQYYHDMEKKIQTAVHLNGSDVDPCGDEVIPKNNVNVHVLWFKMNNVGDNYTIEGLFECLEIWHHDVRGGYHNVWQLRFHGTEFLLIGWPASSFWKLKPPNVGPLRRSTGLTNETEPVVEFFVPTTETITIL